MYMNQACTATPGHVHSGLSFEQVNALRELWVDVNPSGFQRASKRALATAMSMMHETLKEAFRGGEVDILLHVETQLQLDGDRAAAMAWDKAQLTINHGSSSFDEFLWMYGGWGVDGEERAFEWRMSGEERTLCGASGSFNDGSTHWSDGSTGALHELLRWDKGWIMSASRWSRVR